ncbi:MAG: glycoside hydrolase family 38 C-terminal domain-containing protein, partial [Armatimonadota bacterium]
MSNSSIRLRMLDNGSPPIGNGHLPTCAWTSISPIGLSQPPPPPQPDWSDGTGDGCRTRCSPLALDEPVARYEVPFGAVDRAEHNGMEVPALRWAQVRGRIGDARAGALLLNDCKNGHSLTDNVLRIGLIRGTYDPDPMPEIG